MHTDGWTVFDKAPGALVLFDDELRVLARGEDGPYAIDQRFPRPDGSEGWLRAHVSTLEDGGARLERLAERDHLTGLLNWPSTTARATRRATGSSPSPASAG